MARVLVIDNYDSFVYNLVQYLGELGAEPVVQRNDTISLADLAVIKPDGVLISPGPGRPEDAGISTPLVGAVAGQVPILGVCLGHQCIAQAFGGEVVRAPVLMHGKTSMVHHDGQGVLAGLADPFQATRYHSLVVSPENLPNTLVVTATSEDGTVMGVRHRALPVEGVQFHPESILTEDGHRLLANWLVQCGQPDATGAALLTSNSYSSTPPGQHSLSSGAE